MQQLLPSERMLARHLITAEGITGMSVVSVGADGVVTVEPFSRETPNTLWINADVALLRPEAFTEFLLDDLELMVSQSLPLVEIWRYLKSSSLLASPGAMSVALPLSGLH